MSKKNLDNHNRWRSCQVAFRLSQEEADLLDIYVRLSGMTKQDYITKKLLDQAIVVQGNPRVYKALRDQLALVLEELNSLESSAEVRSELLDTIHMIAKILNGMKEDNAYGN